jgi:hypothetical protein
MSAMQRMLSTFDIKATSPSAESPDQLMIDWGTLPETATASIFLPSASAAGIAAEAASNAGDRVFTEIDAHTVGCPTRGVTYLPIPSGAENLAGLIDVSLPPTIPTGTKLTAVFTQITRKSGAVRRLIRGYEVVGGGAFRWQPFSYRAATGTFQLALEVVDSTETRRKVERNLTYLRSVYNAIPAINRWHPIFERYIGALAAQVNSLGGDGNATGSCGLDTAHIVGKIDGLIYDHFGDFVGFILETESGRRFEFFSREGHVFDVAKQAWCDRLRVTVTPEADDADRPRRLVLHPPNP